VDYDVAAHSSARSPPRRPRDGDARRARRLYGRAAKRGVRGRARWEAARARGVRASRRPGGGFQACAGARDRRGRSVGDVLPGRAGRRPSRALEYLGHAHALLRAQRRGVHVHAHLDERAVDGVFRIGSSVVGRRARRAVPGDLRGARGAPARHTQRRDDHHHAVLGQGGGDGARRARARGRRGLESRISPRDTPPPTRGRLRPTTTRRSARTPAGLCPGTRGTACSTSSETSSPRMTWRRRGTTARR